MLPYEPAKNLKNLSDDELSRLFYVCRENVDLFLKLMPSHPFFLLIKKDPQMALKGMTYEREKQKRFKTD